ncbi:MAG: FAD-binding protein, partial [Bacillota bacterium]
MSHVRELTTDVLVVGAGAAGCFAALRAARSPVSVIMVSKCPLGRGGATEVAESFLQAPFGHEDPRDNPAVHCDDTVRGGYLLADRSLARALADDACSRVADLEEFGLGFTRNENGKIKQWLAAGYSYPRACSPDHGGHGIMNTLQREVRSNRSIAILEDVQAVKCLNASTGAVCGVLAVDRASGEILTISAKAVVIATGGNGAAWDHSDVPPDVTGDGMAMAYQAGADLVDMEMVLYYPTVAVAPQAIHGTELPGEMILRRAGAKLVNSLGQEFLPAEIPVRDKLSRLIFKEIAEGRGSPNG